MPSNTTLYDTDFYTWANQQAELLRAGKIAEADIANIAEEIESMGRSEKRELVSRLSVLLVHLMKWQHQQPLRGSSWRRTIEQQRLHLEEHLADNPGLTAKIDEAMRSAYRHAKVDAEHETGIARENFPPTSPFTFEDAMNPDFWPD